MWNTDAVEKSLYYVRAESHDAIYESAIPLTPKGGSIVLTIKFKGTPVKMGAKIITTLMN